MQEDKKLNALSIIQDEHRNLGATLMCFERMLRDVGEKQRQPDVTLLRATIGYIDSFLYRYHHPKEDDYLFPALYRRHAPAGELIKTLQHDHHNGAEYGKKLDSALSRYEANDAVFDEFHDAALNYIKYERIHIRMEETELLPLAREHLRESDWKPIDLAFSAHDDPMFGEVPKQRYNQLFKLITNVSMLGTPLL